MEWISVNDRMPEINEDVLVYYAGNSHGDCKAPSFHILKPSPSYYKDSQEADKWNKGVLGITGVCVYNWKGFRVDLQYNITHWMSLPKPPKEN